MKISCNYSMKVVECNDYSWSNELAGAYTKCFKKVTEAPQYISSVGGGDHIMFTLLHFDSVKIVNNIDVSPIGLLSSLTKLAILTQGTYNDWFELLTGSIFEKKILDLIEKSGMTDIYSKLVKIFQSKHPGVNPLISLSYPNINYNLLREEASFDLLKNRINHLEDFNFVLHDVYNIDLIGEGIAKELSDLFLISNAYCYPPSSHRVVKIPGFAVKSLKVGGYIIASSTFSWFNDEHLDLKLSVKDCSWSFNLVKRIK